LNFFDGFRSGLNILEYNKCLAFCFEIGLCDDVDDVAVLGEDLCEALTQIGNLYALFEVLNVDAMKESAMGTVSRCAMRDC
jgi:hypothetical protein